MWSTHTSWKVFLRVSYSEHYAMWLWKSKKTTEWHFDVLSTLWRDITATETHIWSISQEDISKCYIRKGLWILVSEGKPCMSIITGMIFDDIHIPYTLLTETSIQAHLCDIALRPARWFTLGRYGRNFLMQAMPFWEGYWSSCTRCHSERWQKETKHKMGD